MTTKFMSIFITSAALLITIILHELGHGVVALWMGDSTAKDAGRLSLNPLKHIDFVGALCLYFFKIGWAKPVPINPFRFKKKKLGMILVSIAGVTINFILAIVSALILVYGKPKENWDTFFRLMYIYNVSFAVFNLIPIPPLDGSRLIIALLPIDIQIKISKYERYSFILIILLSFSGILSKIIWPLMDEVNNIIMRLIL